MPGACLDGLNNQLRDQFMSSQAIREPIGVRYPLRR